MSFGQRMNMCNITFIVSSFGIFRHYKIFCVNGNISLYYSQKQDFHSNVLELSYYYLHLLGNNY